MSKDALQEKQCTTVFSVLGLYAIEGVLSLWTKQRNFFSKASGPILIAKYSISLGLKLVIKSLRFKIFI